MLTLPRLQIEQRRWSHEQFPGHTAEDVALLIAEEAGELCQAVLKAKWGIRGSKEYWDEQMADALGDLLISAAGFANTKGWDLQIVLERTWDRVRKRDWRADPLRGGEDAPS